MVDAKAIKDKVSKKINNTRSKITSHITAHKHCRKCGINIDAKSDPRVCKNQECIDQMEKQNKKAIILMAKQKVNGYITMKMELLNG